MTSLVVLVPSPCRASVIQDADRLSVDLVHELASPLRDCQSLSQPPLIDRGKDTKLELGHPFEQHLGYRDEEVQADSEILRLKVAVPVQVCCVGVPVIQPGEACVPRVREEAQDSVRLRRLGAQSARDLVPDFLELGWLSFLLDFMELTAEPKSPFVGVLLNIDARTPILQRGTAEGEALDGVTTQCVFARAAQGHECANEQKRNKEVQPAVVRPSAEWVHAVVKVYQDLVEDSDLSRHRGERALLGLLVHPVVEG